MTRAIHEDQVDKEKYLKIGRKALADTKSRKFRKKIYKKFALDLIQLGGVPMMAKPAPLLKHPRDTGWSTNVYDADYVNESKHWDNGVLLRADGIQGIDCDTSSETISKGVMNQIKKVIGRDEFTVRTVKSTVPRFLVTVKIDGLHKKILSKVFVDEATGETHQLEIFAGSGCQYKLAGPHPSGDNYECEPPLGDVEIPFITAEQAQSIVDEFEELAEGEGFKEYITNSQAVYSKESTEVDPGSVRGMFDASIEMDEVLEWLEEAGWQLHSQDKWNVDQSYHLTRPGKKVSEGQSAHLFHGSDNGVPIFYVFSTSADLQVGTYTPFKLQQAMNYGDDFKATIEGIEKEYGLVDPLIELMKEDREFIKKKLMEGDTEDAVRDMIDCGFTSEKIERVLSNYQMESPSDLVENLKIKEAGEENKRRDIIYEKTLPTSAARNINAALIDALPPEEYLISDGILGRVVVDPVNIYKEGNTTTTGFEPFLSDHVQAKIEDNIRLQEIRTPKTGPYHVVISAPPNLCSKIINLEDNPAPRLYGLMSHPTVMESGEVQGLNTGFDRGLYFSHSGGGSISNLSSEECYDRLNDICCQDILFADEASGRARFIGLLLTLLIRRSYQGGGYGFNIMGNQPGTGKSSLIKIATLGVLGCLLPSLSYKKDEEAMNTELIAKLSNKPETIILDNITQNTELNNGMMAECLSSGSYEARKKYGASSSLLNADATYIVSGNGITLSTELARRIITIVLDSGMPDPAKRKCKIQDLNLHMINHHPEIVSLLLKIVLDSYEDEEKFFPGNMSDFPYFDYRIRNPIFKITGEDILDGLKDSAELSQEKSAGEVFVSLLWDEFFRKVPRQDRLEAGIPKGEYMSRSHSFTSGQLKTLIENDSKYMDLQEAAIEINGRALKNSKSMTNALRSCTGKVYNNGLRLVEESTVGKNTLKFHVLDSNKE